MEQYRQARQAITDLMNELNVSPAGTLEFELVGSDDNAFIPTADTMERLESVRRQVCLFY